MDAEISRPSSVAQKNEIAIDFPDRASAVTQPLTAVLDPSSWAPITDEKRQQVLRQEFEVVRRYVNTPDADPTLKKVLDHMKIHLISIPRPERPWLVVNISPEELILGLPEDEGIFESLISQMTLSTERITGSKRDISKDLAAFQGWAQDQADLPEFMQQQIARMIIPSSFIFKQPRKLLTSA